MLTPENKTEQTQWSERDQREPSLKKMGHPTQLFSDHRPEATVQRRIQAQANQSVRNSRLAAIQRMANQSPQARRATQLQAKANQGKGMAPIQRKPNATGLPNHIKSGVESLSGHSMDDVKVHYNSSKPAQLNAHAYAQGTDIHVAPGQEKHLPHEAWHVVQQKQGRVQPTRQMKGKVNINDDKGLEREADVMGQKVMQYRAVAPERAITSYASTALAGPRPVQAVVQRVLISEQLSPMEVAKWATGRAVRGITEAGLQAGYTLALNIFTQKIKQYIGNPLKFMILIQAIEALVGLRNFWNQLPEEIRVIVKFLSGSLVNWWYQDESKIPDSLLSKENEEPSSVETIIGYLEEVIRCINLINKPTEMVASATTKTVGWIASWFKSSDSQVSKGFNKEAPPVPGAIREKANQLAEKLGIVEEEEDGQKDKQEQAPEQKQPSAKEEESKARTIRIPPLTLLLHKMGTRRTQTTEDNTTLQGGMYVDAGFQLRFFDHQFPQDASNPMVEITIPWMLSEKGHFQLRQLEPIVVVSHASTGIFELRELKIKGIDIQDDGLKAAGLSVGLLSAGGDVVQVVDLSGDWSTSGTQLKGTVKMHFGHFGLHATPHIHLDKDGALNEFELKNFNAFGLFTPFDDFTIASALLDKENGIVDINKARLTLKEGYGLKALEATKIKVDRKGDYKAKLEADIEDLNFMNNALSVKGLNVKAGISKKEGWHIEGSAGIEANAKSVHASGKIKLGYDSKQKKLDFTLLNGLIKAHPTSFIDFKATKVELIDGVLHIQSAVLTINLPGNAKQETKVENAKIDKEGIDWEAISVGLKPFTIGKLLKINDTGIRVAGKEKDYETTINGGLLLTLGEYFHAGGSAHLTINPKTGEYEINKIEANLGGGIKLPRNLIPVWPIDLKMFFPIVPGLEAHGGFRVNGGVSLKANGSVSKEGKDNPWTFKGKTNANGFLEAEINAGLTVGSGYIVGVSGTLFAGVKTTADAELGLIGGFDITKAGFKRKNSQLTYDLEAALKARIGARVEGTAFYIYHKTLYEVDLKEFELGTYEFKGATEFDEEGALKPANKNPELTGTGKDGYTKGPEAKAISQAEALSILKDGSHKITGSGEARKTIIEEQLQGYVDLIDEAYKRVNRLSREKFNMEGDLRSEDYINKLKARVKKAQESFFTRKKTREKLEAELAKYKGIEEEIATLRAQYNMANAIGNIMLSQISDPEQLEASQVNISDILGQIEQNKLSWEKATKHFEEQLRNLPSLKE